MRSVTNEFHVIFLGVNSDGRVKFIKLFNLSESSANISVCHCNARTCMKIRFQPEGRVYFMFMRHVF